MNPETLAYRHALLCAEIQRRMTTVGKWNGLPGLMDELQALRLQYLAAREACTAGRDLEPHAMPRMPAFLPAQLAARAAFLSQGAQASR